MLDWRSNHNPLISAIRREAYALTLSYFICGVELDRSHLDHILLAFAAADELGELLDSRFFLFKEHNSINLGLEYRGINVEDVKAVPFKRSREELPTEDNIKDEVLVLTGLHIEEVDGLDVCIGEVSL